MSSSEMERLRVDVAWEGGMRYRGGRPDGPTLVVDGERGVAPSPVEALVISLGACSAIDVVEVLNKRRTPPSEVRVEVEYVRAPSAPRRLLELKLRYLVATASAREHVERAVALSFETYCSVARSLDPQIVVTWEVEMLPAAEASS